MRAAALAWLALAGVATAQPLTLECGPAWNGCGPAGGVTSSTTSTTSTTTSTTAAPTTVAPTTTTPTTSTTSTTA